MKKPYLVAAALLVFISFNFWNHVRVKEKGKRESELFYTSAINGKITNVSASAGAVYFKVENSEEKYMFIPTPVTGNQKKRFSAFATKGDSISKPAYATYLKLYKGGKVYTFSFSKLHEDTTLSK
ncbi:hypothetical protein [Pontibacter chinhatensis]|uniref:Uncharacterized protein n=1 Tax=Pontibacter chinhatensis TaxID=1436961 RepID=A0A1I2TY77_9BACT|nr:hypothetical protein [Pontibacter chinhatensis]SFG67556.1 hypothetical protein SAMN05421739_103248 [Pontibacter chinhatensis]